MSKSHLRFLLAGVLAAVALAATGAPAGADATRRSGHPVEPGPARDPQHARRSAGDDPGDPEPRDPARRDLRRGQLDRAEARALRVSFARRGARTVAAAAAAGYTVLSSLYPGQQEALGAQFASLLAQVPNGYHKYEGVRVGRGGRPRAARAPRRRRLAHAAGVRAGRAARRLPADAAGVRRSRPSPSGPRSAVRAADSATSSGPHRRRPDERGLHRRLQGGAEPRGDTSTTRTADQTQIAQFWNPPIWIAWNQIAETAALAHHDTLHPGRAAVRAPQPQLRRLGDRLLRRQVRLPLLAAGDRDRAGDTTATRPPGRRSSHTAQDPSYPGAHAVISAAGAEVLTAFFGDRSPSRPVDRAPRRHRSFTSFSAAANEAALSRIYAGQHFRTDEVAGQNLGNQVAGYVLARVMRPVHH